MIRPSLGRFPDERTSMRRAQPLRDFPRVSLYGNYPYQYYQQNLNRPQEPSFVLVTPKSITLRNNKPKTSARSFPNQNQPKPEKLRQAPKMDIKLVQAVQQPDLKFVVDKFFYVPGSTELKTAETAPVQVVTQQRPLPKNVAQVVKSEKLKLQKQIEDDEPETATVKVESIGMSSADQPIPDYSAFFPRSVFTQTGTGVESTLILEPNSRAISGNDGMSISTPISRAILRKGTSVKVLFRPQSVAISGANGVSVAQADLILDFIDDE